jgi:hypothetical protein
MTGCSDPHQSSPAAWGTMNMTIKVQAGLSIKQDSTSKTIKKKMLAEISSGNVSVQ